MLTAAVPATSGPLEGEFLLRKADTDRGQAFGHDPNMWEPKTALLVVLIGISVCGAVAVHRGARKKAQLAVSGRGALSDEEFSNQFFPNDRRVIAVEARRLLKPYIPVNHELVQPSDELVRDLQLAAIDGLDANSYVRDLESAFGLKI